MAENIPFSELDIDEFERELLMESKKIKDKDKKLVEPEKEIEIDEPVSTVTKKKKAAPKKKVEAVISKENQEPTLVEPEKEIEIDEPVKEKDEEEVVNTSIEINENTDFNDIFKSNNQTVVTEEEDTPIEDLPKEKEEKIVLLESKKIESDQAKFLENIVVDLNSIEIIEKVDPILTLDDINFVLNGSGTYQIIASQSCYIAFMQPFKTKDINGLKYTTADAYQFRRKLYQTIHSKMNTSSLGKIDFETFLKITSYFDFESLLYGIYVMSFPGDTKFDIVCGHCGKEFKIVVNNDSLVSTKDPNIYQHFDEITGSISRPEEALSNSLVHKVKRTILPDSKIIVDIQIPTLQDHLNILGSVKNPTNTDNIQDIINTMIFLKKIMVLDIKESKVRGKAIYFEVKDLPTLANILNKLSYSDSEYLMSQITNHSEKYFIDYQIKNTKCPNCQKDTGNISVNIQELVFQQILQ